MFQLNLVCKRVNKLLMIHYLPTLIHFKVKKVNHETKLIKIDYIELIFKGIFDSTLLGVIRSSNRAFFFKELPL